jgi:RimJ/RimL family protein N-acetyltransferase
MSASYGPHPAHQVVTTRLRGERLRARHRRLLHLGLYGDPRVMATLGGRTWGDAEAEEAVQAGVRHWTLNGYGTWVFFREDGGFVGRGGMHRFELRHGAELGLIYHVVPDAWGRGFATEMAEAALQVAFDVLSVPSVASWTLPSNLPSRRVMERCGMKHEGDDDFRGMRHVFYRITRETWRRR